ncbi:MAG: ATP-binding protein, partial [Candidatus Latescibacterota bacterium]
VIDMFGMQRHSNPLRQVAEAALTKRCCVYYFGRPEGASGHVVRDISPLDPGAGDPSEAGWGGLTEFTGRVGQVVAEVVNRSAQSAQ